MFKSIVVFFVLVAGSASALPVERSYNLEPCRYWRYDYKTGTYTCSSTTRLTVYSSREVDRLVSGLESRIRTLEEKVRRLEQGN